MHVGKPMPCRVLTVANQLHRVRGPVYLYRCHLVASSVVKRDACHMINQHDELGRKVEKLIRNPERRVLIQVDADKIHVIRCQSPCNRVCFNLRPGIKRLCQSHNRYPIDIAIP